MLPALGPVHARSRSSFNVYNEGEERAREGPDNPLDKLPGLSSNPLFFLTLGLGQFTSLMYTCFSVSMGCKQPHSPSGFLSFFSSAQGRHRAVSQPGVAAGSPARVVAVMTLLTRCWKCTRCQQCTRCRARLSSHPLRGPVAGALRPVFAPILQMRD